MPTRVFRSSPIFLSAVASLTGLGLLGCEPPPEGARSPEDQARVEAIRSNLNGGIPTERRLEVGETFTTTGACTATLVDRKIVLTAAHCFDWKTRPGTSGEVFKLYRTPPGSSTPTRSYQIDRTYAMGKWNGGNNQGDKIADVGFVRLMAPVEPDMATPALIATAKPPSGTFVSQFGFGCGGQGAPNSGKQVVSWTWGSHTNFNCKGDSGGPTFVGPDFGNGPIITVASGWSAWPNSEDTRGDAVEYGSPGLTAIRLFGSATEENGSAPALAAAAQASGAKFVTGDFNADGKGDVAVLGNAGSSAIGVGLGNGSGGFTVKAFANTQFAGWAAMAGIQVVSGDFDGDGDTDIMMAGPSSFSYLPLASSNRDGSFTNIGATVGDFPFLASLPGVKLLAGDFNGDGASDLALTGKADWGTLPVAFSNRNGTFTVTNYNLANFPQWAGISTPVVGDFNGDRAADIALIGGSGWGSVPVAFSNRNGTFNVTNWSSRQIPTWASTGQPKFAAGDFDGDGDDDIAIGLAAAGPLAIGPATVAFALSNRNGTFEPANMPLAQSPARAVAARWMRSVNLNGGARVELVMAGGSGWSTIPSAFLAQ